MKNIFFALTILFGSQIASSQNFYDEATIQDIQITFSQSNWDQLLDQAYSSTGDYIMAQSVSINGTVYDSVGVKYKGNSTYSSNQVKNPFHIELDTYKEQDYQGYKDIKLSNVKNDPSFVREVLSYKIGRQYMDASLSNYANVSVNGTLIGLYVNSESVSKVFLKDRFDSKNNTFVKCNPIAGAGPQSGSVLPYLLYLGTDSTTYYPRYEMKSDYG
ncbi:MAG: CotH kinase family protein, partial [Crocinitomicaceae bacterium]|nr:CotH kinase family protein [Crocinitomicaceae bacterium]